MDKWDKKEKNWRDPKNIPTEQFILVSIKVGIDMNKIPEGIILDSHSYHVLETIVDNKKQDDNPVEEIVSAVVAYLRGYAEGMRYAGTQRAGIGV